MADERAGLPAERQQDDPALEALLDYLRSARGFDFTGYKRPSLARRILKRMHEVGVEGFAAYQDYLEVHPGEFAVLFDTILINVTAFFRDPSAWEYLEQEVVPRLVEERSPGDPIRAWCAGCSSGEEAYSTAIVLARVLGDEAFRERVKIYATDVDEDALTRARHGAYPPDALEPLGELADRYFELVDGRCVFRGDLRRCVIFGRHDLVQDAPISRIDLLVCRNTLMYFNAETQRRILGHFAFALRDGGFLFLGKSETLIRRLSAFRAVDLKRRIFEKLPYPDGRDHGRPLLPIELDPPPTPTASGLVAASFDTAQVAQIVVDRRGMLLLANPRARHLFGLRQEDIGRPLRDLELSYRPLELRSRIDKSYAEGRPIAVSEVELVRDGEAHLLDVLVTPLGEPSSYIGVNVTFLDVTRNRTLENELQTSRHELETAYEELQSTIEELETTNEELQSTNEELETTNEELQSTNEELETMNEELQSTNEELETMNDELRQSGRELDRSNEFLSSILASMHAGVAVVDRDLRVQLWNDEAADQWGLRPDEVRAEYLPELDIGLPLTALADGLRGVATGRSERFEQTVDARNRRGRDVRCRVSAIPLRSTAGRVSGAIVLVELLSGEG